MYRKTNGVLTDRQNDRHTDINGQGLIIEKLRSQNLKYIFVTQFKNIAIFDFFRFNTYNYRFPPYKNS